MTEYIYHFASKLEDSMWKCGFKKVQYDQFQPRLELLKFYTDVNILSFLELPQKEADIEQKKPFNQLVQDVREEVRQGAAHGIAKFT